VAPLVEQRPDQSGVILVDGNLDAFAVRALSARRAGRSLDLQYYIWHDDLTGRLLAHEVVTAADRGVRAGSSSMTSTPRDEIEPFWRSMSTRTSLSVCSIRAEIARGRFAVASRCC
jgi:hypothetical protein